MEPAILNAEIQSHKSVAPTSETQPASVEAVLPGFPEKGAVGGNDGIFRSGAGNSFYRVLQGLRAAERLTGWNIALRDERQREAIYAIRLPVRQLLRAAELKISQGILVCET